MIPQYKIDHLDITISNFIEHSIGLKYGYQRRFNLESERYGRLLQMNKIRSAIELIIYEVAHAFT